MNLSTMQEALKEQIQKEYDIWYHHIKDDIDRKKDVLQKVIFKDIDSKTVRVNLLWKNIKLENALYLSDESLVTLVSDQWILWDDIMKNANKVIKFDNEDMDLLDQRRRIIFENALYWASVTVVDWYDDEEQQPINGYIHPLSIIPDPRNWTGSRMRFIWFTKRVNIDSLRNNSAYSIPEHIEIPEKDSNVTKVERSEKSAVWSSYIDDEWMCDVYHHYTTYKWMKYLTSWINGRNNLVRCIELWELSQKEIKNPDRIQYPIQIHRRNPLYNSFFWVSLADEVLQYQDPISILTNLLLMQSRIAALWPDKYVSNALWIDLLWLENKPIGGRIIPVNPQPNGVSGNIYNDIPVNPSQFPTQMIQELESRAEGNTGATSLAFWQSQSGSQTKSEVQTLMQNTNQLLNEVANNYLRGEKEYWEAHYKAYELYMGSRKKKSISFYKNGSSISHTFQKKEFVSWGKVIVYVESKAQIKKRNEKDFAKLNAIAGFILQNMKPWYAMNEFLRKMLETVDIYELEPKTYIPESVDEMRARMNIELLNNDIEIQPPVAGEDFLTYIEIYKQALDTPAKQKALDLYTQAYIDNAPIDSMEQWRTDPTSSSMAMSIVNSNLANKDPSINQITA